MKTMDAASLKRLNETIACLRQTSKGRLNANLYQKIVFLVELNHFRAQQDLFAVEIFLFENSDLFVFFAFFMFLSFRREDEGFGTGLPHFARGVEVFRI